MRCFVACCITAIILSSCHSNSDYQAIFKDPILYSKTVFELNNVVMGNNFSPIVASRNYMYANVAAYEVIAAGYPTQYNSFATQLRDLKPLPKPDPLKKINFEFASLLAFCNLGQAVTFPEGSMKEYVDSLKKLATDHGMPSEVYDNSVAYADAVSKAIMEWSKGDNYARTRSAEKYTITSEEGRWIPTPPSYASAMEPHWKEIRPLVMDSANQLMPPPPFHFDVKNMNSEYCKQVMESKEAIENLTPEQKHIADFWDDNPFKLNVIGHIMYATKKFSPPGHWMSIVGIASKRANADFATTVYAYAKTSVALFDAFIQCWRPYLQTPPFPEYTCGHSTCSSAAAEALTSVYGDNLSYTDTSELMFGIKSRSYKSFRAAADENNWARFYGGIHFHPTCIVSTEYGKKVGNLVVNKLHMKKLEDMASK
jgi:hypothetical protein